jgi:hypothetical protein
MRPNPSFDDLVSAGEDGRRDCQAERIRGFEVNHEFEFGGLIDWNISWFNATKDLVHIVGNLLGSFGGIGPIGIRPEIS